MGEDINRDFAAESKQDIIAERARLLYVGITRAKRFLHLTCAKHRTIFGSTSYNATSRFIKEIPDNLLDGIVDNDTQEKFNDMNIYVVENLDAATKKLSELTKDGDVVLFENDLPDNYNEK